VIARVTRYRHLAYAGRLAWWLWLAMLLVHLPALVGGWGRILADQATDLRLTGFILLNISTILFVLKLGNVRWLRFGSDRRSIISLTVAVALLHVNVGADAGSAAALPQEHQAAAAVLLLASLAPVQRFFRGDARRPSGSAAWTLIGILPADPGEAATSRRVCPVRIPRAPPRR
jgi:hypothetical protein